MLETTWESRWLRNLFKNNSESCLYIELVLPVIRGFKELRFLMTDKTVKCTLKTSYREIIDEIFLIFKNNLFKTSENNKPKYKRKFIKF